MKKILFCILVILLAASASADVKRYSVPVEDSPYLGSSNAPVTIIEFIDYQ